MKFRLALTKSLLVIICMVPTLALSMTEDDPLLTKVMSEFELFPNEVNGALEWDIDAWLGRDLGKVWLKSSGELINASGSGSEVENANIELVVSRAAYTTWDQQFGVRHDFDSDSQDNSRNWLSFGYIGTAPYFIEVDARVFVGEESSTQLLVELEREIMLTQQWVLTPELDIIANGRSNERFNEGSGLAEIEFSLRLGYEANGNRKLRPFIGLSRKQTFGNTRRIERSKNEGSNSIEILFGLHSWF